MAYKISTDIDWANKKLYATVSSDSHQQVTGLYYALADSRGSWLCNPTPTLSGAHSGFGYVEYDFSPFQGYPQAFMLSGRTDQWQRFSGMTYTQQNLDGAGGIAPNFNSPGQEHFLAAQDDFYIGREMVLTQGSRTAIHQISDVTGAQNLIKVSAVSPSQPLVGVRGDYVNHSGYIYRVTTGSAPGTSGITLDKNTSNISIGDWIKVYPVTTITDYDALSGAIYHDDTIFHGADFASTDGYSDTANGPAHVDITLNTTTLPQYFSIEEGDIFLYTPNVGVNVYTGFVTEVASTTGFTIITGGYGSFDNVVYSLAKMDRYAIDMGPQPDTSMMGVLLDSPKSQSGNILHTEIIPPEQSKLEINFNEYDSSVASVGTKAHFHIGPVVIGGYALTGAVSSATAALYGGDTVVKTSWAVNSLDLYADAEGNDGMFYEHTNGVFVLNTTESFAQADMLTLRAAVIVNGRKVERGITIASQPVV